MREIYFIPYPCHRFADPYHDGHAHIHVNIPLQEDHLEVIDNIRIHCAPAKEPEFVYSVEVKPREYEIELQSFAPSQSSKVSESPARA